MENTKSENKQNPAPAAERAPAISLPPGDVLVKRIRGVDGMHPIGPVVMGRIYTMTFEQAATYCVGDAAEFSPVMPADKERIDKAASDRKVADLERQRAELDRQIAAAK